jgi:predicted transcriptional regulator
MEIEDWRLEIAQSPISLYATTWRNSSSFYEVKPMSEAITLTLPDDIRLAVDREASKEGVAPDDLVSEALRQFFFQRRFRLLRERMMPQAREQGIFTDEDVFDQVS